jgi:hypothetical protein
MYLYSYTSKEYHENHFKAKKLADGRISPYPKFTFCQMTNNSIFLWTNFASLIILKMK